MQGKKHRFPRELSGSEQQRVAIARAIVKNPKLLLCDEPTGALDFEISISILKLIERVNQQYGTTIIMITHNAAIADMANRVFKIRPSVMGTITYFSIPAMKIKYSFVDLLIGIFMPALFLSISSYFVVWSILKKSPADLMKGSEKKAKVNALERAFKLERFKFSTKFRLREQIRSISRLLFLILGITSASVLMLFGLTIMNSYNYVFNDSITEVYKFEYEYALKNLHDEDVPDGVEIFTNGRFYPQDNEKIEFYINGIEPDSRFIFLKDMDGNLYSFTIDTIANSYAAPIIYMPIYEYNKKLGLPENSYLGL